MAKILNFNKTPREGLDKPTAGITEIRKAIEAALLNLSKRFSILEDEMVRADIGNVIYAYVVDALENHLLKINMLTREFDIAVLKEVIASLLEQLYTEIYKTHTELAEGIGESEGRVRAEIENKVRELEYQFQKMLQDLPRKMANKLGDNLGKVLEEDRKIRSSWLYGP